MTQQECALGCGRPIHDVEYGCQHCGRTAADRVGQAIALLRPIVETITRQDRTTNSGATHTKPQSRPPSNLAASEAYGAAKHELRTQARHISEERGIDMPDSIAGILQLLSGQMDWLRYRPEAAQTIRAILDAVRTLERIPDSDGRILIALCPCQTPLRVVYRGQPKVSCTGCGTTYDSAQAHAQFIEYGREFYFSAADAADLLIGWDGKDEARRERCRKLINQWAVRGLIQGDAEGRFEFGPLADRWNAALAARVA